MHLTLDQLEQVRQALDLEVDQESDQVRIKSVNRVRIWPFALLFFALWLLASVTSNSPYYGAILVLVVGGLWARSYAVGRRKTVLVYDDGASTVTVHGNVFRIESLAAVRVKRHDFPVVEIMLDRKAPSQSDPVLIHKWEQGDIFCHVPVVEAILLGTFIADALGLPVQHNKGAFG